MSKPDTWMPLYIADYLADTMSLNGSQHGAYLLLLMQYWRSGPLPNDQEELASIARTDPKDWSTKVWPRVSRYFSVGEDGLLHQKRADHEKATARSITEQRSAAGAASARKRAHERNGNGTPNGIPTAAQQNGRPSPSPSPKEDSSSLRSDASGVDEKQTEPIAATEPATNSQPLPSIPSPIPRAAPPLLPLAGLPDDDARTVLFRAGLDTLRELTGKGENAARALLGRLLREARDDPHAVLAVLGDAGRLRPADTVPWLMAAVKARGSPGAPPGRHDRWGLDAWIARQPDVEIKQLVEGSDETGPSINGYWLRWAAGVIAEAADLPDSWRGSWDPLGEWCRCEIDVDGGVVARVVARLDGPVRSLRVFTEELYAAALARWQREWRGMSDAGDRFRPRLPERIAA